MPQNPTGRMPVALTAGTAVLLMGPHAHATGSLLTGGSLSAMIWAY